MAMKRGRAKLRTYPMQGNLLIDAARVGFLGCRRRETSAATFRLPRGSYSVGERGRVTGPGNTRFATLEELEEHMEGDEKEWQEVQVVDTTDVCFKVRHQSGWERSVPRREEGSDLVFHDTQDEDAMKRDLLLLLDRKKRLLQKQLAETEKMIHDAER